MTRILRRGAILVVCAALGLWASQSALSVPASQAAAAGGGTFQIEVPPGKGPQGAPGGAAAAVPANCSTWHELYPTFCNYHHQDAYTDNGDGVISACDFITFDGGLPQHIDWVGPTYFFDVVTITGTYRVVMEPSGAHNPNNPVCEMWHVVYAQAGSGFFHCDTVHIDVWTDKDGSGGLSTGDQITISTTVLILRSIGLDIITSSGAGSDIPALNEWGVLALALLVIALGLVVMSRRVRTKSA